ncbi:hypothetical protein ACLOJK_035465 [Asimina triloba]
MMIVAKDGSKLGGEYRRAKRVVTSNRIYEGARQTTEMETMGMVGFIIVKGMTEDKGAAKDSRVWMKILEKVLNRAFSFMLEEMSQLPSVGRGANTGDLLGLNYNFVREKKRM